MTIPFLPAFELTVYAPRSVDPTETTVLTPAAGASHSDPFVVTSVQGVTGAKPYLDLVGGRSSTIDPLNKTTSIGTLTVRLLDSRVAPGGSNAARWATAFLGDGSGGNILLGRKYRLRRSLDGGATWAAYSVGRLTDVQLDGKLWVSLTARDLLDDLGDDIFVGTPAASVASYAHQSQLYPLGLLQAYGSFPIVGQAQAVVGAPQVPGDAFTLDLTKSQPDAKRLIAPRILVETLVSGNPFGKHRLVVTRLDTHATTEWELPRAIRWSTSLERLAASQLVGGSAAIPPTGTAVEFYVRPVAYPVSEQLPLLINDVNPVTYLADLCAGKFGRLDASGTPIRAVPFNANGVTGAGLPPWRRYITKASTRVAEIETVCRHYHWAYFTDATGAVTIVDLRRSSTTAPVATLTDDDLVTDGAALQWAQSRSSAVTILEGKYYPEMQVVDNDLPKPFDVVQSIDDRPDIPPVRVQALDPVVVLVAEIGPRSADMKPSTFSLDGVGFRYVAADPNATQGVEEPYGALRSRAAVFQQWLDHYGDELSGPFGLGPSTITIPGRRGSDNVAAVVQGSFVALELTALPDPATNARGGPRLALCISRTENNGTISLQCLDAGANAVALAPTLGVPTLASGVISLPVTLNADGESVRVAYALTDTTAGVAPAEDDVSWLAGPLLTASGTATLDHLPTGRRVWLRARSVPVAGLGFKLPSAWAFPTPASLDIAAIPAPSGLVLVGTTADAMAVEWVDGDASLSVDVYFVADSTLTPSGSTRIAALLPGSIRQPLPALIAGTTYTVGVQHRDPTGGVSALVTLTFVASVGLATLDPPTDANGFSGTQDPRYGFPKSDGVYGLAVAATEFPGYTEYVEQVETARNAGTYADPVSIGTRPNIQGDWTIWQGIAPNDGLRRILAARHVRDGATASAYTTGVVVTPWTSQALGLFSQTAGTGAVLGLSFSESSDGTQEQFIVTVGAKVDTVIVHYRTVPINATGKIFDFSEGAVVNGTTDGVTTLVLRPVDGEVTFSVPHPARFFLVAGRIVPYANGKEGPSWPFPVQAAPPAINVKLTGTRTGAVGAVAIGVAAGPSDLPGTLDVYLATITGETKIITAKPITAASTALNSGTDAALGNLALPTGKDSIAIRAVYNDPSGQEWDFGPLLLNRDPLPQGTITVGNYRAAPPFSISYDPDTDSVIYTAHDGKTKTWNRAALDLAGSVVTYTVGVTPLDDGSLEIALMVNETRSGAHVDFTGGGTTVPNVWAGDLHGQPQNPPTVKVDVEPQGAGGTVDVYGTVDTDVDEQLYVNYRLGITDTALEYYLCAGAADQTQIAVGAGNRIGPSHFFMRTDLVGSPTALLSGIALTHDQIDVHQMQAVGAESGMPSAWTNVQLSLLPLPLSESGSLKFDPAGPNVLTAIYNAGARVGSVGVEFADNEAFSAPITASADVTDGTQVALSITLSDAQLGRQWHARFTPFSLSSLGGLVGIQTTAACPVPAVIGDPQISEVDVSGPPAKTTLSISIDDRGGYIDQSWTDGTATGGLHAVVTALGVATEHSMTSHSVAGTVHTWTLDVAQDAKHPTPVQIFIHFIDGSEGTLLKTTVDLNKVSDGVATAANHGQIATVTAQLDPDSVTGANKVRYTKDNRATYATVALSAVLQAVFDITRTTLKQTIIIQGTNKIDGAWGNEFTVDVDASDAVTPILTIEQGTVTATVTQFTVNASNPQASGAAPTVTLTPKGCSITLHDGSSTVVPDGTTATIAVPMVFDANRPASTQATEANVEGDATITGGGASQRIVKVLAQLNLGPSLTADYVRTNDTSGTIVWTCTNGTVTVKIDGGSPATPSASPIPIALDDATHTYLFQAVVDGQTISAPVSVPKRGVLAGATFSGLIGFADHAAGTLEVSWSEASLPSGVTRSLVWSVDGGDQGTISGPSNPETITTPVGATPSGELFLYLYSGAALLSTLHVRGPFAI